MPVGFPCDARVAVVAAAVLKTGYEDQDIEPDCLALGDQPFDRAVFRLRWKAGVPSSIIVKKSRRAADVERVVYQAVLPRLSVRAPLLYDVIDDGDEAWLVLEDAGDRQPSFDEINVVQHLSRCVAAAHHAASHLDHVPDLPDRGPDHFRRRLGSALAALAVRRQSASNSEQRAVLDRALEVCHTVDAQWALLQHACAPLPRTLVHGDLVPENLRLGPAGEILLLDWEKAGWGRPAVDLASLDLAAYRAAITPNWPRCTTRELERAAWAGRIFRVLVHNFASKPTPKIQRYATRLSSLLREAV